MTASTAADFAPFRELMLREGLPEIVVRTFEHYYGQLVSGATGMIPESDIAPVTSLPDTETFSASLGGVGEQALSRTVLLKLNGGLGTGMGLERAKSLLVVKEGLSFLDVIARQAQHSKIPLVLMNSFSTRDDSLAALSAYPALEGKIPLDFMQHKVPKVLLEGFAPAEWPEAPELAWCPPGHGDIYTALVTTGMLEKMLSAGYEYAFVSNSDNLGATIDPRILGYFVQEKLPFMMECAVRTPADKKGGHLARRPNGQLLLRESAQCPPEDSDAFQDITRHRFFNTNSLWVHLPTLQKLLAARDNILGLAMIRNRKTLDPRDANSPAVYQLETAMGAAIAVFEGAGAVQVPRSRFAPVKTCSDLLSVRSDDYVLTSDFTIVPNPAATRGLAVVNLDSSYYKLVDEMEARFPHGPPSLLEATEFEVSGDVLFGANVTVKGAARVVNRSDRQLSVEDGAVLSGERVLAP